MPCQECHAKSVSQACHAQGVFQECHAKSEQALSALSQILIRCSAYRYDILEVFSVGEVFLAQNVRPSFLGELLMNLNLGSFTLFVEKFIADYDLLTKDPRIDGWHSPEQNVLFMETVQVQNKQGFNIYLLVVTNRKVFLLEPCRNKPTFAAEGETFECWDASWEAMFPREPTVLWERDFSSLVRVWLGYGSQILAVEWQGPGKGQDLVSSPSDSSKIQSEVYLFHRPDRCTALAEILRAAAAQGEAGMAVPILMDPAFRNLVLAQTQEEQMLATTVAVHGPKPRQGLFTSEQKADPTPRLFVLTAASVLETCRLSLISSQVAGLDVFLGAVVCAWAPIKELDPTIFDDFTPADLEEAAEEEEEEDVLPAPSEDYMALRHLLRLCGSQLPVPEGAPDGSSRPVLSLVKKYALPPSPVVLCASVSSLTAAAKSGEGAWHMHWSSLKKAGLGSTDTLRGMRSPVFGRAKVPSCFLSSWSFDFDHIFRPEASQAEVFEEISLLVQSALDGYRVAILAYGQTGSGKTYTMLGPSEEASEDPGVLPRTVEQLKRNGWEFEVSASMAEVYNENVVDLIAKGGMTTGDSNSSPTDPPAKRLVRIRKLR
eukprot:s376_g23.t1